MLQYTVQRWDSMVAIYILEATWRVRLRTTCTAQVDLTDTRKPIESIKLYYTLKDTSQYVKDMIYFRFFVKERKFANNVWFVSMTTMAMLNT